MNTRQTEKRGLKANRMYKLITTLYLSDLEGMDDFLELMTHLDNNTLKSLEDAARVSLIDQEYNK